MMRAGRRRWWVAAVTLGAGMVATAQVARAGGGGVAAERGFPRRTVMAHRGLSSLAPELTLAAFAMARDVGADYVETDIQRTRDGVLINIHDETFARTTNVSEVFPGRENDPIGSFTLEEVRQLDAGAWFNEANPEQAMPGFVGLRVPTLEEYLEVLSQGTNRPGLLIEIKDPALYPGIEAQVLDMLVEKGWIDPAHSVRPCEPPPEGADVTVGCGPRRVILQTFDPDSLARLRSLAPSLILNYLVDEEDADEQGGFQPLLEWAVAQDAEIGAIGYLARPRNIRKTHREGRLFFVWTLDKPFHFRLAHILGVDGIITNRAHVYLELIGRPLSADPEALLAAYR